MYDLKFENSKDKAEFEIAMILYDEFNDKFCEMYDWLGEIYSWRDIRDLEEAEKAREEELRKLYAKELSGEQQINQEKEIVENGEKKK